MWADVEKLPKRRSHDHYATARIDVVRGLDFLWETVERDSCLSPRTNRRWCPRALDPGAGEGSWGTVLRERCDPNVVVGFEVRPVARPAAYDEWVIADFLAGSDPTNARLHGYDLVIGNPPYSDAEAFVRRSLGFLKEGGYLLFLLRLTFLESQGRAAGLFKEHPPLRIAFCGRRPSFSPPREGRELGPTGPDAYTYIIWRRGFCGEPTCTWV